MSEDLFSIRKASEADMNDIMSIVHEAIPILHATGNYQWDENYPQDIHFRKDIGLEELYVAVHVKSGVLAGVGAVTTDQPDDFIEAGVDVTELAIVPHRVAVSPKYRGQGIAQKLIQKAEDVAREKKIPLLRIDTNVVNLTMLHIFKKLGYIYLGEFSFKEKPTTYGKMRFCCFEKRLSL
ncbi:GNAT family N-acetyltransferase [archaeon]|nr:MAG: GNAT family N-acetyltransferase [archaeon]